MSEYSTLNIQIENIKLLSYSDKKTAADVFFFCSIKKRSLWFHYTVKLGCVLLNVHINVSHVVYFCTIVLKGHFILMVTALISNIFRHQKSAIMVHFDGKNIAEKK